MTRAIFRKQSAASQTELRIFPDRRTDLPRSRLQRLRIMRLTGRRHRG
jgi:hypothetical protein